ncbi:MAG: hydroxyethylthiazole kinase [Rhodospirillales bacterium]
MDKSVSKALTAVRQSSPAVHCITNSVAQNFTANVLLALGAHPSMTHDADEVGEFVASADALLVNLGTLDPARRRSIDLAITSAENVGIPWVLDPVMIERSHRRAESAAQYLLRKPTVLRANSRETALMAGGSDENALRRFAQEAGVILAVTGAVDHVVSANSLDDCRLGSPLMHQVTGFGCALSAVIAAFLAANDDPQAATLAALHCVGEAGERAAAAAGGPASFAIGFIDELSRLGEETNV